MGVWSRWWLGLTLAMSCKKAPPPPDVAAAPIEEAAVSSVEFRDDPDKTGLGMRLYEAGAPNAGLDRAALAPATALSDKEAAALLARLPAPEAAQGADFALRQGPQPPPRTGQTVLESFPPPPSSAVAPAVDAGPLRVTRKAPTGAVPMAPHLSVSFSQPMVAVTSQAEAARTVPVKLSPAPEGQWRWLGTQTLIFEPEPRFPMATRYTVEIPAGSQSASGVKLAAAESWTFETPPPKLESYWPFESNRSVRGIAGAPQPADPLIFLGFDQAVSPTAIAAVAKLVGPSAPALRVATEAEIAAKADIAARVKDAEPGRAVVLTPAAPLALASAYKVVLPAGTPSAEGPLTTTTEQSFQFRTYGELRAVKLSCWDQKPCPPSSPWNLEFTNPLDLDAFDPASITVTPAVPGVEINAYGNNVSIYGAFAARTTYTVKVAAGVRDIFGQKLAEATAFTISTGPAEPSMTGPPEGFVLTDPNAAPALSIFSVGHKALRVTVHRVGPDDWQAWIDWQQRYRWEDARKAPFPGKKVASQTVQVVGAGDQMVETTIDLKPWLSDGLGQLIVQVEPTVQPKERWNRQEWLGWVQSTRLGLSAFQDGQTVLGWVSSLSDGAPVAGAELSLLGAGTPPTTTGSDGLGPVELGDKPALGLVARAGADVAILPADPNAYGGAWYRIDPMDQTRWYVFDDKNLYKPGETVHVRGWMRKMPGGKGQDLQALSGGTVRWSALSSMGNPLGEGTATVSASGGFSFDLKLPDTPNLGTASILLSWDKDPQFNHGLSFEIQEYRTPEFEVATSGGDGVYALGEHATVDVRAAYYAGGGLAAAPVTWTVTATPGSFVPPGRSDWSFGAWAPWWRHWSPPEPSSAPVTLSSSTDAGGEAHLGIHFESLSPPRPMTVTAEASVVDVNRQAWTSSKSFLVHPAAWYVGLKTTKTFVEAGQPIELDHLVVDREGAQVAEASVELSLNRLVWKRVGNQWREVSEPAGQATGGAAGRTSFTPASGGSYALTATVRDAQGRKNETEIRLWVSGGELAPDRGVSQEEITLAPDKQSYAVGESATIGVVAPFFPAEGLLTLRAGGLLETRRFTMDGATTTLKVPITEAHVPDLTVAVDLVGARTRSGDDGKPRPDLAKRVAFAAGSVTLNVPPATRTLGVKVVPAVARLSPGGATKLELAVTDASGQPVAGAELAVVAVDEAVLSLTGYRLPDPLNAFYAARGDGVSAAHLRQYTQLVNPLQAVGGPGLGARGEGAGGGGFAADAAPGGSRATVILTKESKSTVPVTRSRNKSAEAPPPPPAPMASAPMEMEERANMPDANAAAGGAIAVRSDFAAVALWAPEVRTDAAGKASVELKLPDNLTRYRVMAVAVSGARHFGSGEADVTARLPLMVRPSAPRFLNFGDRFELPVVVQNQTDAALVVDVAVRASNASFLGSVKDAMPSPAPGATGVAGRRVTVPPNDRVEVRFPTAAALAGEARFQLAVASGAYADAAEVTLPVWTPATTEAFATYGTFEQGAVAQSVVPPADVWSQYGGLEVTLSTTQLSALTDAFVYLVRYPYDCNEQIASRVLAVATLRDVLRAFGSPELPSDKELDALIAADLERLERRQNSDGGWAFWRRGDPSWPYLGLRVAHALVLAESKGFEVDKQMKARALAYADSVERRIPGWYSKESKWYLRGYALHVLGLAGQDRLDKARKLLSEAGVEALPAEAKGWILPTLARGKATSEVASLKTWLGNHLSETAAGAHLVTGYDDGAYVLLHSSRVVDGVWLDALLQTEPKNDLVPKLVNGLLAHRKAGRWSSTNESALVLASLDRYFRVYESVTPDLVARVWLGDGLAGEHAFKGRQTDRAQIDVPMGWLQQKGASDLIIGNQGAGRLYYRVGMRYAPLDLDPEPADYGFTVLRSYEAVDDPADVRQDADGTWRVKAGARVRVRLTMVAPARRYHVALVDPMPAGFEALNPELKGTGALPADPTADKNPYWWWSRPWYEHENLRDERVEAFASLLWDGVHRYSYVARATTPGDFVAPPAKAEEMYSPETFGRSDGDRVVVE